MLLKDVYHNLCRISGRGAVWPARLVRDQEVAGSNPVAPMSPIYISGCSVVWLARLVWDQEVAGSNPATPIFYVMKVVNQLVSVAQPDRATAF